MLLRNVRFLEIVWEIDLYANYAKCAHKRHLLQGLAVFVACVQCGSHPCPFRTVLRFNVRFDGTDIISEATLNRTLNLKTVLNGHGWLPNFTQGRKTARPLSK